MLAKEIKFIERFKARASHAAQVQSRVKKLDKIERVEPPKRRQAIAFDFLPPPRSGDATAPLNAYGRTKRDGEEAIRSSGCAHLILRTSWVYSLHGANFLRTMVRLAATRDHLRIVGDQFGVPTPASFIADATAQLKLVPQWRYDDAAEFFG